jgi:hypothetical protein
MILGLRVRALDVDATVTTDNTGLTGEALRAAVKEDQARGLHPFVLSEYTSLYVLPAGLTNSSQSLLLEQLRLVLSIELPT